ncbi:MAG: plastocyanin/azurin family copper-binding protein [Phycisphaerales bacterium]
MACVNTRNLFLAPALAAAMVGASHGAVITVSVSNFAFTPANVTAAPGDTIRWVRVAGNHTATSGASCSPNGTFDLPVNSVFTSATWVVPASAAGTTVRYYCAPHCTTMQGTIVVTQPPPSPDLNGDGVVNGNDLGQLLAAWGATGGPADLNQDGAVNGDDLGILLGAWTV